MSVECSEVVFDDALCFFHMCNHWLNCRMELDISHDNSSRPAHPLPPFSEYIYANHKEDALYDLQFFGTSAELLIIDNLALKYLYGISLVRNIISRPKRGEYVL